MDDLRNNRYTKLHAFWMCRLVGQFAFQAYPMAFSHFSIDCRHILFSLSRASCLLRFVHTYLATSCGKCSLL